VGKIALEHLKPYAVQTMQNLLDELAETQKAIEGNAHHITLLQVELRRFQREGKDADEVRRKLAHLHTLHMQVLAVQERLRKALKDVRGS
jgi:DNA-binding ferritin-like protein